MSRAFLLLLTSLFVLTGGCQEAPPKRPAVAPRQAASKLSILVVDDSPLAAGIKLLRGEWTERSGGQLEIEEGTIQQLLDAKELSADLIIYPSRFVGTLVDRNWLRPVRKSVLQSEDVAIDDMFSLIRNATLPYGEQVYGLTLGEPPLMLALEGNHTHGEKFAWDLISNPEKSGNTQLEFPYAVALLARGVAYAQQHSGESAWFDPATMQPRIAQPPYVKALQEMIGSEGPSTWAQVGGVFGWPQSQSQPQSQELLTWVSLSAAGEVYSPTLGKWKENESADPITFLGFAGRSVSVARSTRNSASAFKLLKWFVSEKIATQLSPRSESTVWFRKSQATKAKRWLPKGGADDATAAAITKLLSSNHYYLLPRIPGIDEYLEVLDKSVRRAISEVRSTEDVLAEVVENWDKLTDRYGRERQRVAYRRHLGLDILQPVVKSGPKR